jgi:glucose/arabinose dehydrogenase
MVFAACGRSVRFAVVVFSILVSGASFAQTRGNPNCPGEEVFYDPGHGEDIVLPKGYKVEVFAKDLNFPTAIAFQGNKDNFKVFVVESGTGLPSRCNNNNKAFTPDNPFTPDLLVFDKNGRQIAGPIGKPGSAKKAFQPDGPAIGLAFENVFQGGTLFGTDSNQGVRGAPGEANNTSRVVTIDVGANEVRTFIGGLPTGDHPTEQILVKDGFVYWSQGSATNSSVVGHDNGGAAGPNEHDIACQDVRLSENTWPSGDGHETSAFSKHGQARPGALVKAFEDATQKGMCTGAILRARVRADHPEKTVEPFSWGYRNPFGIRFPPKNHTLADGLFVTENGEDERGARPTNNAPDRLQLAKQTGKGTPDFHGWPDRFGFLDSTQAVFDPQGGPSDDLGFAAKGNPRTTPVKHALAFPPQAPIAPLAIEPTDVAVVGPDFAPNSFVHDPLKVGAALVAREGDFGFSTRNGLPIVGHDIELVNFSGKGKSLRLELSRFAFNCRQGFQDHLPDGSPACKADKDEVDPVAPGNNGQAFANHLRGINRPLTVMFGPDGALYLVDFGAVRDVGRSDPKQRFKVDADGPLVQIPHTGVIWKITSTERGHNDDDNGDDDD